ncbi:protein translocase subunit [Neocucurbitaria cava]|uniref:Mitochondrial import inner membrane translocase subunit n=1 Tax=Neocucurbitaria cava TaxID=798079 RepID=A0A9W8Y0W4_9PLEO|nr:protein translocase subunit [Neocucurbitaria cava]
MDSLGASGMSAFPGDPYVKLPCHSVSMLRPALTDVRVCSKTQIMRQVQQEAAMQNARMLVEKLNEHCFERCVPKPGTSLSKGEETCFTSCMEKYMSAWNTVSKQYVARIQRESAQSSALQNL